MPVLDFGNVKVGSYCGGNPEFLIRSIITHVKRTVIPEARHIFLRSGVGSRFGPILFCYVKIVQFIQLEGYFLEESNFTVCL